MCGHLPPTQLDETDHGARAGREHVLPREGAPEEAWPGPRGASHPLEGLRPPGSAQRPSVCQRTEVTVPGNRVCLFTTQEGAVMLGTEASLPAFGHTPFFTHGPLSTGGPSSAGRYC